MEYIESFFVAVMAGVVCHFVCKWLESNGKQVRSALKNKKESPKSCHSLGICSIWNIASFCLNVL